VYGFDVDGELTPHGVTRPVTLVLGVNGFTRAPTAAPGAAARAGSPIPGSWR
jgi:polyisoprenoid-binding protein YceI